MRGQRTRVHIGIGDVLETAGAGIACWGVARLVGLWAALILAGVLLVIAGELIYSGRTITIGLPHRPQPRQRARESWERWTVRRRRWQVRRQVRKARSA